MKNKNNAERLKKITRALRLLIQVCFWASLAAAALAAVIGLVLVLFPGIYSSFAGAFGYGKGEMVIELNDMLRYSIVPDVATAEKMKPAYLVIIFGAAISGFILAPFLYQLKSILKSAEDNSPFDAGNAKRLTWMGMLIIVYSIVCQLGKFFALKTILDVVRIPDMTTNYNFDTGWIIMGLLLFILAGIFRYGSYLQEEYDATL